MTKSGQRHKKEQAKVALQAAIEAAAIKKAERDRLAGEAARLARLQAIGVKVVVLALKA